MTLEQIKVFVSVAERLHMTRGAKALHMTQSAASAAIAALEARYGVRLFNRVGRGLELSEAGRAFLPEARAVLMRAELAAKALDDLAGLRRGAITVAASQTVASYWLPPRMTRFAEAHPGVSLQLKVANTAQVAQWVLEGQAELGFVEGAVDLPVLAHRRVASDRIGLYAAPDHPLLAAAITREDLRTLRWVLREPGSGTRSQFEHGLRLSDVNPADLDVVLELPSNEAVLGAVAESGLATAVSELAAQPLVAAGRVSPLPFALPGREFELITHTQRRPSGAVAAFIDHL